MPTPTPVPETSLLGAYAKSEAFTDCYATTVPGIVGLSNLVEAFYTTRLFKLERWLLATALNYPATDLQAKQLALAESSEFSAWRVENRADREILLAAWQTRLWLCVEPQLSSPPSTVLFFGSAVIPMSPEGKFGPAFHLLSGFHRLYSKLLLSAASKRVITIRKAEGAA